MRIEAYQVDRFCAVAVGANFLVGAATVASNVFKCGRDLFRIYTARPQTELESLRGRLLLTHQEKLKHHAKFIGIGFVRMIPVFGGAILVYLNSKKKSEDLQQARSLSVNKKDEQAQKTALALFKSAGHKGETEGWKEAQGLLASYIQSNSSLKRGTQESLAKKIIKYQIKEGKDPLAGWMLDAILKGKASSSGNNFFSKIKKTEEEKPKEASKTEKAEKIHQKAPEKVLPSLNVCIVPWWSEKNLTGNHIEEFQGFLNSYQKRPCEFTFTVQPENTAPDPTESYDLCLFLEKAPSVGTGRIIWDNKDKKEILNKSAQQSKYGAVHVLLHEEESYEVPTKDHPSGLKGMKAKSSGVVLALRTLKVEEKITFSYPSTDSKGKNFWNLFGAVVGAKKKATK